MRIVVDVTPLSHPRTGVGNYVRGSLGGLAEAAAGEHEIVAFAPVEHALRASDRASDRRHPVERRLVDASAVAHTWRTRLEPARASRRSNDSLGSSTSSTSRTGCIRAQRGGLRTTMIHDLVPLRFPEWVRRDTRPARREVPARRRDVRPDRRRTRSSRRTTSPERSAFRGSGSRRLPRSRRALHARGPRAERAEPYALAMATLEPRKNLLMLVAAHALVRAKQPSSSLVVGRIAGCLGRADVRAGVTALGLCLRRGAAGAVPRGAAVFAYPSFFEGFGIPVSRRWPAAPRSSRPRIRHSTRRPARRPFASNPDSPEAIADGIERRSPSVRASSRGASSTRSASPGAPAARPICMDS